MRATLARRLTGSKNEINLRKVACGEPATVSNPQIQSAFESMPLGQIVGTSRWIAVDQPMIDAFGRATLDPDPMHIDPAWARQHGPFGGTIAFGFLTISLLTHLLHDALGSAPNRDSYERGYYLNYGFDRLRLVSPVKAGARVRGVFRLAGRDVDERQRYVATFDCTLEIEDEERPALVATWLTVWVPPEREGRSGGTADA
jgi:acyl dehydratase